MFDKIKSAISGKKTYLVATAAILTGLVAWSQDQISLWELGKTVFAAVGTMTMRAAVAKTVPVEEKKPTVVNFYGGGESQTLP